MATKAQRLMICALALLIGNAYADSDGFSGGYQGCIEAAKNLDAESACRDSELAYQKKRLNKAYASLSQKISPEDKTFLEKVQRDWLTWRNGNYAFLSEHVAGAYVTTRITSQNFLLSATRDRARELEMILDELGG